MSEDGERSVFERWLLTSRSVYGVEGVRYGRGLAVRDLRSGERLTVDEKTASRQIKKGQCLLMRLAPVDVDGSWQAFGGAEPVAMHREQAAIAPCDALEAGDAGPQDLVTFATARFVPPTLQSTDGAPLGQCSATYDVVDNEGFSRPDSKMAAAGTSPPPAATGRSRPCWPTSNSATEHCCWRP